MTKNIKYPSVSKVTRITNKKPETNRQTLEMENQIEKMRLQIDELETSANSFRGQSNNNSQGADTTALQSQITQNANNISTLQTSVGTNTNNISTNTQNISSLQTATQTNSNNISSLQTVVAGKQDTLTAGDNITINNGVISATNTTYTAGTGIDITNNVISATASGGGSGSSCNCASDIANIQAEQIEQNNKIDNTKLNFDYAKKYLALMDTPTDPNYNPQTYTPEPTGTIFQTQAEFDRKYNKQFTKTLTTPKMIFSADDGATGTLLVKVNFTANENFTGTITIYNNNTSIFTEEVEFSNETQSFQYSKTVSNITCSAGNMFHVKIVSSTNTSIVMTNSYAKLTANNAEVINQISPFNVEYFNGKYYISDCSSGTAKIAEIAVSDMKNMFCLDWHDTGIECWRYGVSFKVNKVANKSVVADRVDYYQTLDEKLHFDNKTSGLNLTNQTLFMTDWSLTNNNYLYYIALYSNYNYACSSALDINTGTFYNFEKKYLNYVNCCAHKYKIENFSGNVVRMQAIMTKSDGSIYADYMNTNSIPELRLGFGTNCHSYYVQIASPIPLVVFAKHYNKILRYDYNYNANQNGFTLDSISEIGEYCEYFDGVNNDYFVVKDKQLFYYKK